MPLVKVPGERCPVRAILFTWTLSRLARVHYLSASYAAPNGWGTLYLHLDISPHPAALHVWCIPDAVRRKQYLDDMVRDIVGTLT